MPNKLRLGFHYHSTAVREADGVYTLGYVGRFIDSLAAHCEHILCFLHTPVAGERSFLDYRLRAPNIELVDIGPHWSVPKRMLLARRVSRPLRRRRDEIDALLLRGPSPLLSAMARAAGDVPTVLLLVGDYVEEVDHLQQASWRKEAIRLWARWNHRQQAQVARRSLTLVNSGKLYEQFAGRFPHVIQTRTTTIDAADFFEREDTCTAPPYRLLYTGRISRSKGVVEVVQALGLLVRRGVDAVLDLVGWVEEGGTSFLEEVQALVREEGVQDRVTFHGFKALGPELFAYYRQADVYVIGSRSSFEGFPRTIWEAMAHSVPVVATRVGGIPFVLRDRLTARLVEPGSSTALAAAVEEILTDAALRQTLVREGKRLAQEGTLDRVAAEMVAQIEAWVEHRSARPA